MARENINLSSYAHSGSTQGIITHHHFHPSARAALNVRVIARWILAVVGIIRGFLHISLWLWRRHIHHRRWAVIHGRRRPPRPTDDHPWATVPAVIIAMPIIPVAVIAIGERTWNH